MEEPRVVDSRRWEGALQTLSACFQNYQFVQVGINLNMIRADIAAQNSSKSRWVVIARESHDRTGERPNEPRMDIYVFDINRPFFRSILPSRLGSILDSPTVGAYRGHDGTKQETKETMLLMRSCQGKFPNFSWRRSTLPCYSIIHTVKSLPTDEFRLEITLVRSLARSRSFVLSTRVRSSSSAKKHVRT